MELSKDTEESNKWKNILEEKNQMLYSISKKLEISEALLAEVQAENESLKTENNQIKINSDKRLKEELSMIHSRYEDKQEDYKLVIKEKNGEIEKLKLEISNLKIEKQTENRNNIDETNENWKEQIDILSNNLSHLQFEHDKLYEEKMGHLQALQEKNELVTNLNENLKINKEELARVNLQYSELFEEMQLLRTELLAKNEQSQPVKAQGNSLFAEVNDRRLELQKNMSNMKKQHENIKLQLTEAYRCLQEVRHEKDEILKKWKRDLDELTQNAYKAEDDYKRYTEHAQALLDKVVEVTTKNVDSSKGERRNERYKKLLEDKDKQIAEMTEYLKRKTLIQFQLTQNIRKLKQELIIYHQKVMEQEAQLKALMVQGGT